MKPVRQQKIRTLLRENPSGLTSIKLAELTGLHPSNIRTTLKIMPDVYVDRWVVGRRGQYEKVWCIVDVPEDCPHPKDKVFKGGQGKPRTVWQPISSWGINAIS